MKSSVVSVVCDVVQHDCVGRPLRSPTGKPQHGKHTYLQTVMRWYNPKDLRIILIFHADS